MNDKRPGMQQLVDRLLDGSEQRLSAAELDAVLSWLTGSDRHDGDVLAEILGHALDHPRRRIAVYDQLDFQLFEADRLILAGAHLEADIGDEVRRARYRRLMKAYHPDSYPEHADWLTPRSQAIHQSYARFRKGKPPEAGGATPPNDRRARRPAQRHWPAARRSARLTPHSGPGPLLRLRTWLLGIDNLQQRILIGLAVVCLVPVLYAYLAYKPYRAIQSPESAVETPSVVERRQTPITEASEGDRAERVTVESRDDRRLARSIPEAVAPIRPSWERSKAGETARRAEPIVRNERQDVPEDEATEATEAVEPAPEASLLELAAWAETLSDTASATLERASNPLAAAESEPPPAAGADRPRARQAAQQAESQARSKPPSDLTESTESTEPAEPADAMDRQPRQPATEREIPDRGERDARDGSERADAGSSAARQPERAAEKAPPRTARTAPPDSDPDPESAPERAEEPASPETEPANATRASERTPDRARPAEESDALDEQTRRHIEELLAGYRTSFENGWLDNFLDCFTAEPRENKHSGRGWFRSNYGWLFDNSERRQLALEIMDISRTDSHWTAIAQFDLHIDYDDRPDVHSSRKVRYRIETNEHDQFRIAAIEY